MASIKDLKKRIVTVKNTQQTTRAMKMVSAAKLRRAQEAIMSQRPYANQIERLIGVVTSAMVIGENQFPLLSKSDGKPNSEKRVLLVLVTSDRGLCGGFNGSVIKACQKWLQSEGKNYRAVELAFVGRRGHDFFKTKKVELGPYYHEVGGKVTFVNAKKLSQLLVERFLQQEVDEVKFIYNEFKNAATQEVKVHNFLPFTPAVTTVVEDPDFIIKPDKQTVLVDLLSKNFAIQAFRIMLESQAGEHGARMSAMENATKNAGEMIRKLTLQYNKQRQAGITKELLEIISGSESQKS